MNARYSYDWYMQQFEAAKDTAEQFILSVDEAQFVQPPAEDRWCIAECYSHLINYGNLFIDNLTSSISRASVTASEVDQPFEPRWLARKITALLEPPYKFKLKTLKSMKPDPVSGYNRMELLDEYVNLQERLIAQLEQAYHNHIALDKAKMPHPLFSWIRLTLTECFAIIEAHQRRHQWQAEQTLQVLKKEHTL